jgi:polar amino acid transport system substrate-binding protein
MAKYGKLVALLTVVALALFTVAIAGCSQPASTTPSATTTTAAPAADLGLLTPGTLVVGSDTTFPPFESINPNTNLAEGFDVDMMNAIGKVMGVKVVFQTENFNTIIASLVGHKFDVVVSGMTITADRQKTISFSDPYFDSNQSIAVLKSSNITTESALYGKKIGVQSGTTGEMWATQNLKSHGAIIVPFKDATGAFAALQAGSVSAVVNDLPVTAEIIKEGPTRGFVILESVPTGEQYGIGVAKDHPALLAAINSALAKIKADGTLQQIYSKWIPTGQ